MAGRDKRSQASSEAGVRAAVTAAMVASAAASLRVNRFASGSVTTCPARVFRRSSGEPTSVRRRATAASIMLPAAQRHIARSEFPSLMEGRERGPHSEQARAQWSLAARRDDDHGAIGIGHA